MFNIKKPIINSKSVSDKVEDNILHITPNKNITDSQTNDYKEIPIQPRQPVIPVMPNSIPVNRQYGGNNQTIEYDEIGNKYIITKDDIKCVILMDEIIQSIINTENISSCIKEFIFIITPNAKTNHYEYNFIDSIFTQNLRMMIKLFNEIYPLAKAVDFNDITPEKAQYNNNIITFCYQLILFIFKTTMVDKSVDDKLIVISYSTITFCFTELLLKQSVFLKNKYSVFTNQLQHNNELIHKIHKKIADMNNQIPTETEEITSEQTVSEVSGNSQESETETETETKTKTETQKTTEQKNNNPIQKNNVNSKYDILTSIDFNSDNGYKEFDDNKIQETNPSYNTKSAKNNANILTL